MAVTQCSSTYCSLFYVLEFLLQAAFSTQKIQNVLQVCTVCIAHLSHFTRHLSKVHRRTKGNFRRIIFLKLKTMHLFGPYTWEVSAVVLVVAHECLWNAEAVGALELVFRAGRSGAVSRFIWPVQTVVVAVADPRLRDAPLVLASEVPGVGTLLVHSFLSGGVLLTCPPVILEGLSIPAPTLAVDTVLGLVGGQGKAELLAASVGAGARVLEKRNKKVEGWESALWLVRLWPFVEVQCCPAHPVILHFKQGGRKIWVP